MRRLLLTVLTICSLGAGVLSAQDREIRGITDKLSESLSQSGKRTVAVVDFTDLQGNVTELGRFLAEEISASLAESAKGVRVIDRTNLKVIIQENKLASSGIIDPASARRLGQIAGVDSLITGTLTPFGDSVHLSIKILDTSSAAIVGATRGDIPKTKAIEELLGQGVVSAGNAGIAQPSRVVPSGSAISRSSISTEQQGIRVAAEGCKAEAERLVCTLVFTSQDQDRRMTFRAGGPPRDGGYAYTRAFDDGGLEYGSDSVVLAGKASDPDHWIDCVLVSGVPTRMVIRFNRFSPSSSTVTMLELKTGVHDARGEFSKPQFQLRSIPVSR
jgi:TolB-like protein